MKRCFLFALALMLSVPMAFAQRAVVLPEVQAGLAPGAGYAQADVSPVIADRGDLFVLDRGFGNFAAIGNPDGSGFGYFDLGDAPNFNATRLYAPPVPTGDPGTLPTSGTFGPDGLYYFIGLVRPGVNLFGLYTFNFDAPEQGYEELIFPITDFLELGDGERLSAGLAYDAASNEMRMVTCFMDLDDEGNYRQSLVYSIDVNTGIPTYLMDIEDPNGSPEGPLFGVCPWSFTWDGGDEMFVVDIFEDDLAYVDLSTGQVVQRYSDPFILTVNYAQDSSYNPNDGVHYLMPFSVEPATSPHTQIITSIYACTPATGCEFQGLLNTGSAGEFSVEMTAVGFLDPKMLSSSEEGASAQGVRLDVYPNPMASQSTVVLALDAPQAVTVAVYDLLGRQVATLHEGIASQLELSFAGQGLPSGVYFVSARGETFSTTQKVVIAR